MADFKTSNVSIKSIKGDKNVNNRKQRINKGYK